jgi:hypothetical protein
MYHASLVQIATLNAGDCRLSKIYMQLIEAPMKRLFTMMLVAGLFGCATPSYNDLRGVRATEAMTDMDGRPISPNATYGVGIGFGAGSWGHRGGGFGVGVGTGW